MGFNSLFKDKPTPAPDKKAFGKSNAQQLEMKFVPSTKADLKRYAANAAAREEERKNAAKKITMEQLQLDLNPVLPFEFKRPNAFRKEFFSVLKEVQSEYLKKNPTKRQFMPRLPKYEAFEKPKFADGNFVFAMQGLVASMHRWLWLQRLLNAAAGREVKTKDWSEAFHMVQDVLHMALGVKLDSTGTRYRLSSHDFFDKWKIEIDKRKLRMPKNDDNEKIKLKAAAIDDDEEESDDENETEETEEEDEDKEEEKPVKKRKKKAPVEESEVSDDEEEKPVKKKAKTKKGKPEKAAKGKPAKRGPRASPDTVYKVKKQFDGGVRGQTTEVIPAKGATVEQIGALLKKKHGIDPKKAKSYVNWLSANGYLTRVE